MLQDTKELGIETIIVLEKLTHSFMKVYIENNKRNTILYYAKINFLRIEVKYTFITFFLFFLF